MATFTKCTIQGLKQKGLKAYETDTLVNPVPTYSRRDYFYFNSFFKQHIGLAFLAFRKAV